MNSVQADSDVMKFRPNLRRGSLQIFCKILTALRQLHSLDRIVCLRRERITHSGIAWPHATSDCLTAFSRLFSPRVGPWVRLGIRNQFLIVRRR